VITVAATPGILSPGTYTGTLTITATNPAGAAGTAVANSPVQIPVTFNVAAAAALVFNPGSVSFAYTLFGAAPLAQTVEVTGSSGTLPFSAAANTTSGPQGWLTVNPSTGQTPARLTISIDPARFTAAGTFNGSVTVTSPGAGNSPANIPVTVTVSQPAAPVLTAVRNAASYSPAAISPGENIVIGGTRVGPPTVAGLVVGSDGRVSTSVSQTRVLFDGIPAPIVYVSENQSSVIVPYEIAGRATTNIQVEYQGVASNTLQFAVAQAAPGIYTQNQQGNGPGVILNEDNSVNGAGRAAAKGAIVVVYMTGEGQTSPAGVTGSVAPLNEAGLKRPVLPVTATVGGLTAEVVYAGSAPGFVTGVMQVNLRIPANAPSGAQPLVVSVGGTPSQASVTVAVQ
jgi:uncharacterized protein (TIGR03437 family)